MKKPKMKEQLEAIGMMRDEYEPRIHIPAKMLKEIKKWDVGEEYELTITAVMEDKREDEHGIDGGFRIKSIKAN